jgi:F-type H+-transporting ATPase subunit b
MADKVTGKAHGEVHTGTGVPEGVGPGKAFPPLDPTGVVPQLFWLALTFGLLYLLMKRFALPRVSEVIEERRERIERDLAKAEALKGETELALASYERALGEARTKAGTIGKDVHAKLMAEVDAERAKVDTEIAAHVAEAEARIDQARARAMAGVGEIAGETAGAIVAKLIGREVSQDEVKRALMQRAAE